jgi:hypothetical protein
MEQAQKAATEQLPGAASAGMSAISHGSSQAIQKIMTNLGMASSEIAGRYAGDVILSEAELGFAQSLVNSFASGGKVALDTVLQIPTDQGTVAMTVRQMMIATHNDAGTYIPNLVSGLGTIATAWRDIGQCADGLMTATGMPGNSTQCLEKIETALNTQQTVTSGFGSAFWSAMNVFTYVDMSVWLTLGVNFGVPVMLNLLDGLTAGAPEAAAAVMPRWERNLLIWGGNAAAYMAGLPAYQRM